MTDTVAPEEPLSEGGFRYSDRAAILCRTCMRPITWETRTEPGYLPRTGWYDDARSDPLICFKAVSYRHEPLTDREWAYYKAGQRSVAECCEHEAEAHNLEHEVDRVRERLWRLAALAGWRSGNPADNDATAELYVTSELQKAANHYAAFVGAEAELARLKAETTRVIPPAKGDA